MLELTLMMVIGALIFFTLRLIFKTDEINFMSLIMSSIAIACMVKDTEINSSDDMILYLLPMLFMFLMSIVSFLPSRDRK